MDLLKGGKQLSLEALIEARGAPNGLSDSLYDW